MNSRTITEENAKEILVHIMTEFQEKEESEGVLQLEKTLLMRRFESHLHILGAIVSGMLTSVLVISCILAVVLKF
jgi:hypothetical protein